MSRISLPLLSRPDAEDTLARLWLFFVEHGLRTPKINIEFKPDDRILLSITAEDPQEGLAVFRAWAEEWSLREPTIDQPQPGTETWGCAERRWSRF
jgi:hypothetical protein